MSSHRQAAAFVLVALAACVFVPSDTRAQRDGWRAFMRRLVEARRDSSAPGTGWDPGPTYSLDDTPRHQEPGRRVDCPTDSLVTHRGTHLRYRGGGIRVHEAFVPRLERFEALARDIAVEVYGREPRRIRHKGTYSCRRSRGRSSRISEHALGNALDLKGFEFGPLPRGETLPEGLHRRLRWRFAVTVSDHWSPRRERDEIHAEFLHRLTDALATRPEIFRGIVGPPRPRHHDHLHLDVAPWRYRLYRYE